jgi:hypothetical protein
MPVGQEVTAMIFFIGESFGDFAFYFELGKYVATTLSSFLIEYFASNLDSLPGRQRSEFLVDELLLGTHAENFEHGLTDTTIGFSEVKRAMIKSVRESEFRADASE